MTTSPSDQRLTGPGGATRRKASVAGLGGTLAFAFAAQLLTAAMGVLVVPAFLRLMGAEGYGLAAFYAVLQAWMLLFDLGLAPTLARQLSRFRAGALPAGDARNLFRAAETFFVISGLAAAAAFFASSPWIAVHWLRPSHLAAADVDMSLRLMAALLVFRWLTGLYQAALVGLERQTVMNAVALAGAALRYGGSVAALAFISRSPVVFFAVQLAAAVTEAVVCRVLLALSMPRATGAATPGWTLLRNEFHFAAGMIVGSAMATMINQADKLALSHALPLRQFGVFGLVVSISMGIAMVAPPFVQVFQPRLTTLLAQDRRGEFIHVYRLSAALILAVTVGLAGAIAAQPVLVIYAWTGQRALAAELAPTLTLYAAGSGVAAFLFTPFLLQYAQGRVRLHVIGNVAFGAVWIPAAVWAAFAWGTVGTGAVWLTGNLAYLLLWTPVIHARLLEPEERRGILTGVWVRALTVGALLAATRLIPVEGLGRAAALATLAAISLMAAALTAMASPELREFAAHALAKRPAPEGAA